MNIVHVVRQFSPSVGGLEDVVLNLALFQSKLPDRRIRVLTLDRLFHGGDGLVLPACEQLGLVEVIRIPYVGSARYPLAMSVLSYLKDADLVHVHAIDFFFDFLALTRPLHRKPMVASTHGGFFHTSFASTLKEYYFSTVTRWSARRYDRILATSVNDGDVFSRIVEASRLDVIENGVDVERYRDLCADQVPRRIVYFGRWSENKGLPETIRLLSELRKIHSDWCLTIVGREYDLDRHRLHQLCIAEGVDEAVMLRPAPSDEEFRSAISGAGYFCSLSRHEGFGLTAVESMAAGLYPLLSDIPPYRRLIELAGEGMLIKGSIEDAAAAIEAKHHAIDEGRLGWRERLKNACERYRWSRVAEEYERAYADVLGLGSSAS